MTRGTSMSGRVTLQSIAMPPVWITSPMTNPSMIDPEVSRGLAILIAPETSDRRDGAEARQLEFLQRRFRRRRERGER